MQTHPIYFDHVHKLKELKETNQKIQNDTKKLTNLSEKYHEIS